AHHERISLWTANCPENFANRLALIGAEMARIDERHLDAQQLYEEAVRLARRDGFLQNQALACERAGTFYAERGLDTSASAYLRQARECYERWGASGKVRLLDARYPHLLARDTAAGSTSTVDRPLSQLDVETVDRASQ